MTFYSTILVYNIFMNEKNIKGDWAYYNGENFVGYTLRHKVRLFFGINGQSHSGKYYFKVPNWGNLRVQKMMYTFMFYVGNPVLNFFIGYKRI